MYVMKRCGFGMKWIWIWKCVSMASFSVLLNGVPKGNFGCGRDICQGDLLSPLLFLLIAGVLSGLLGRSAKVGMYKDSLLARVIGR